MTPLIDRARDGRDEMNLADFPISALSRAQKTDGERKVDRMELTSSRYDAVTRRRVTQKVTLTSTARDGLPTPADEHVILALLFVAKHTHNFSEATVHFSPPQLFEIMGWAPNGRSYTRLRDVLRRLKALTIRYENSWWDISGRAYEEELATGIVAEYRIGRQTSGPRKPGAELASWVTWGPRFQQSLRDGNLKRLDLEVFFKLKTPTAQRMYRFLDKRFYSTGQLTLDLVEFACGHVGLTDAGNVALLKRRLTPGLAELEAIGFLAPEAERFVKVKAGQWRIVLRSAKGEAIPPPPEPSDGRVAEALAASPGLRKASAPATPSPAVELVREFYRLWGGDVPVVPGPRDVEQAERLINEHGPEEGRAVIAALVQVTRKEWPDCRSLSGAMQKYLADARKVRQREKRRAETRRQAAEQRAAQKSEVVQQQQSGQHLRLIWDALPEGQRQAIEQQVRERVGGSAPAAFVLRLCLAELERRLG